MDRKPNPMTMEVYPCGVLWSITARVVWYVHSTVVPWAFMALPIAMEMSCHGPRCIATATQPSTAYFESNPCTDARRMLQSRLLSCHGLPSDDELTHRAFGTDNLFTVLADKDPQRCPRHYVNPVQPRCPAISRYLHSAPRGHTAKTWIPTAP